MDDLLRTLDRKEERNARIMQEALGSLDGGSLASKTFRQALEVLDLPDHRKILFINRFILHVEELEAKKWRTSKLAAFLNSVVSIGSVVTPAGLSVSHLEDKRDGVIFWSVWGASLVTGISTAFLSLFKLEKSAQVYADVLRKLVSEGTKYLSLTDEYKTRYELNAHDTFFPQFASNIEAIILSETRAQSSSSAAKDEKEDKEMKQVVTQK